MPGKPLGPCGPWGPCERERKPTVSGRGTFPTAPRSSPHAQHPIFPGAWSLPGVLLQEDTPLLCIDHPSLTFSPTAPGAPSWPGSPWGDRNRLRAAAKTPTLPTTPHQTHCQHPRPRGPEHGGEMGLWGTAGTPWPGSHLPSGRVSPWDQADLAPLGGPAQAGGKEWG